MRVAQFTVDFLVKTGVLARLDGHLRTTMSNDSYILFELQAARSPDATTTSSATAAWRST
jgi:hypothetical protein